MDPAACTDAKNYHRKVFVSIYDVQYREDKNIIMSILSLTAFAFAPLFLVDDCYKIVTQSHLSRDAVKIYFKVNFVGLKTETLQKRRSDLTKTC